MGETGRAYIIKRNKWSCILPRITSLRKFGRKLEMLQRWLLQAVMGAGLMMSAGTALAAQGLVGYYRFDEASGSVAQDSSGNNNNGALVNAPGRVAGMVNGCLSFNGTTQYVEVPHSASL